MAGIAYCFLKNGRELGSSFLPKLMALYWVQLIRFTVLGLLPGGLFLIASVFVIPADALGIITSYLSRSEIHQTVLMTVGQIVVFGLFFWRLGSHFKYTQDHTRRLQQHAGG